MSVCDVVLILLLCIVSESFAQFGMYTFDDGSYTVYVKNVQWLQSAPTYFYAEGEMKSLSDGTLILNSATPGKGIDELGKYESVKYSFTAGTYPIDCTIRQYGDNFVVFEQAFLVNTPGTRPKNCSVNKKCYQETTGAFPSFSVQDVEGVDLGYLNYGGNMIGNDRKKIGRWNSKTSGFVGGIEGGPIAIFDSQGNTLLISTLTNFMASSFWHDSVPSGRVNWGVMGGVENIPRGYTQSAILVAADSINKAFENFGVVLETMYGTSTKRLFNIENDVTLKYLGYWTDNGGYYYYYTEKNKTYQDTIKDVYDYAKREKIPYRHVQLDSWWYYQGYDEGVKQWTARPDIFPGDIISIQKYTNWPIAAHNRYWAIDNVYAKQNGGPYDFVIQSKSPKVAVPNDSKFWYDLLSNATRWGLVMYEQDWLDWETNNSDDLREDISLGEMWLKEMGQSADMNDITIQYCMALPRHALTGVLIPAVTQARASIDYHLQEDQWKIGISSIFAHALGFVPSKDTFWTTQKQDGNPRYPKKEELWPALQTAVATLSMGPVGPSDMINSTDKNILMRCCNVEGLVLKPSKPALAIDKQIIKAAFPEADGPTGQVWTTVSSIFADKTTYFGILLAANMTSSYKMRPGDAGFPYQLNNSRIYSYNVRNKQDSAQMFNSSGGLLLEGCTSDQFCLYYFSPIFDVGNTISIYGEMDKYVPMSPQRVTNMIFTLDDVIVVLTGVPGETIRFAYERNNKLLMFSATFTESRYISYSLNEGKIWHHKH